MTCSLNSLNTVATMVGIAAERRAVVGEALTWIGTPFHHGARVKGAGVDCAQLLIAVYHKCGITPAMDPGYYPADWFLHERGRERILELVEQWMVRTETPQPGDVATFMFGRAVSHAAIVLEWPTVIHAYRGRLVSIDRADIKGSMANRFVGAYTPVRWVAGSVFEARP